MRALLVTAGALLAACGGPQFESQRLLAMGTWVEVIAAAPDPQRHSRAMGDITAMLRAFERDYYAWGDGELARLNRDLERHGTATVGPELATLLRAAQRYSAASGGAFEPAVGELVELWGFHDETVEPSAIPEPAAIEAWLARDVGIGNLDIGADGQVTLVRGEPAMLDLGGIAKGEAVDRIIATLRAAEIDDALVNAGGDLRVIGTRDGRRWRIGVQSPRAPGMLGVIELASGEAAFTSGDYERFYEKDGRRFHHIIDPSTGYPVTHTQAVTVIATSGVSADAAATALLVAGPDHWASVATALGVSLVLRVDASGAIEMTAPMRERFQPDTRLSSDIIVIGP